MTIIDWPEVLSPAQIAVSPPSELLSSGRAISGSTQDVPARRPPFRMSLQFSNLFGDKVLAWRAVAAHLSARGRVRVPLFDALEPSDAAVGFAQVPHSDGTPFSDGTLYTRSDITGVTVTAIAGMRNIDVDFGDYGQIIQAGQYFNIGIDPHIATRVSWAGSVASIGFESGTKRNHAGAAIALRATMVARLPVDASGAVIALDYGHYGAPSLELEEALDGPFS